MLVLLSLIWILVITIPISLLCAYRKNSLFDHAVRVLGMVGICTPAFALGIFLLLLFAVRLHIFSVAPEGRLTDYIIPSLTLAFPALIIAAAMVGTLGKSIFNSMLALMLALFAWYVRMVRSYTLTELNKDYITAAKIAGCTEWQIILNHLLPNIIPQFAVYVSTGVSAAILTLSAFSFVGLGLPVGVPEWGMMLSEARGGMYSHAELLLYPALCIIIAALGFNLLGEVFRDISEEGS